MANFIEQSINTYSGLSTETKPTTAAGNNVPNGSRWREVDTNITFFFNIADDTWYPSSTPIATRLDYDGADMIYRGTNINHKAATSATDWVVYKYTYSSGDLILVEGPLIGTWDSRAALDWT